MPVLKRTLIGKKDRPAGSQRPAVVLPTEPSETVADINAYNFLIHGEKKIGKTTLTTAQEGVFLLTFDPLQKSLGIMQRHVPDWPTFMDYLVALEKAAASGKYPYTRVVVDGADIWYRRCQTWCEKKLVVDHISEEKWGRGWDLLKSTASTAVDRLLALPGGCWFISHSKWQEVETRHKDRKIEKLVPLLKAGGEEILVGKLDGWFAYDYIEGDRVLIVRGDERTGAGNRCRGHFQTPDGRPVIEIPMGEDEFEAWDNVQTAWANKQPFATLAERDGEADEPPPAKKGGVQLATQKKNGKLVIGKKK